MAEQKDQAAEKEVAVAASETDNNSPNQFTLMNQLISDIKKDAQREHWDKLYTALTLILNQSKEARVYFRTSKALHYFCQRLCGGGVASPLEGSHFFCHLYSSVFHSQHGYQMLER